MKNIHVIGTNEPSRFFEILGYNYIYDKFNKYSEEYKKLHGYKNKHIYITNDEVIDIGDWVIYCSKNDNIGVVHFINGEYVIAKDLQKKIILTTDQGKIKDGIQPIDDTFLEWYVHNQSCEYVETEDWYNEMLSCCISKEQCYCFKKRIIIPHQNLEQETLKEVVYQAIGLAANKQGIINQALATSNVMKILQERMYSDEDLIAFSDWAENSQEANDFWRKNRRTPTMDSSHNIYMLEKKIELFRIWFEQFKKK
jgi:uncharacterized protein YheU (UPF0270 family)